MGWTAPTDRSTGYVVTAADWNVPQDDLTFLSGSKGASVATSQTTASTTYVDLGTVGPAVTVTTGTSATVDMSAWMSCTTNGSIISVAVSGATTLAAADANGAVINSTSLQSGSATVTLSGLTAGSNTFTLKYRVTGGTGTFQNRQITVNPLP